MARILSITVAVVLAAGICVRARPPAASPEAIATTVVQVRHQSVSGSDSPHLAKLRGVVTAFSGWNHSFFLQDATGGISIDRGEQTQLIVGAEVEVRGTIQPGSFAPIVVSSEITV